MTEGKLSSSFFITPVLKSGKGLFICQKQNVGKLLIPITSHSNGFHKHKIPTLFPHCNPYQNKFLPNRHEQDKD